MATLNTGKLTTPNGYHVTGAIPIDDRSRVTNLTDLITTNTFGLAEYNGQITYVKEDGNLYLLVGDTLKTGDKSNWKKIATEDSISQAVKDLGPVFKFKGVASAIDPDHTTLTIGAATVSGSTIVGANKINFSGKPLISYGTVLQENLDSVKYAWGTSEYPNLFFTDKLYTTKDDEGQAQYERGAKEDLQYINVFDTLYFYKREESVNYTIPSQGAGGSPTTGTRNYTVWEALDNGGTLYSLPNGNTLDIYTVTSSSTLPDKLVTGITSTTYKYYEFTPLTTKYVVNINSQMESITASSENNGHVYQLGEEEYASNGHMWVQLGSPKTDWIVL